MNQTKARNVLLLFLAAFIWGTAFAAQSAGMEYIEPFTFSVIRSLTGSAFLIPCIFILKKWKHEKPGKEKEKTSDLVVGGTACGVILCVAANLQQAALLYAGAGKAGFLTSLYIVIVPIFGIFAGKKPARKLWISVLFAVAGLYLLCAKPESAGFSFGDALLLAGAAMFALHIMAVDHFARRADGVKLSCIQFFVCGVLSAVPMLLFEEPSLAAVRGALFPLLYVGILSSGIAYTFQIIGQKGVNPVAASLIMSLESVISALAGWVVLGQELSGREIAGCAVMFFAILLAQLQ